MKKIIIVILATLLSGCAGIPICEKSLEKKGLTTDERRIIEIGSKLLKFYPYPFTPPIFYLLRLIRPNGVRIEIKDSPEIDAHVSKKWSNKVILYRGLTELTDLEHELAMILAHETVRLQSPTITEALICDVFFSALLRGGLGTITLMTYGTRIPPRVGKVDSFSKKERALIAADFFAIMISHQAGYNCLTLIDVLERIKTQYPNSQYYKNHPLFPGRKEWIRKVVENVTDSSLVPGLAMCLFRHRREIEMDTILKSQEFTKEQLISTASFMGFETETIQNLTGQEIITVKIPRVWDPGFLVCNDKILRKAVPKDYPWHQKEKEEPSPTDMIRGNF